MPVDSTLITWKTTNTASTITRTRHCTEMANATALLDRSPCSQRGVGCQVDEPIPWYPVHSSGAPHNTWGSQGWLWEQPQVPRGDAPTSAWLCPRHGETSARGFHAKKGQCCELYEKPCLGFLFSWGAAVVSSLNHCRSGAIQSCTKLTNWNNHEKYIMVELKIVVSLPSGA